MTMMYCIRNNMPCSGITDIEHMFSEMNCNMPISRRTLQDYLENGNYTYQTKGGVVGTFDSAEAVFLSSVCTEVEKTRLRLPIFVSTDSSSEDGSWKVEGKIEALVVARILRKRMYCEDFIRLCYSDLVELRKTLPEVVVVLFLP